MGNAVSVLGLLIAGFGFLSAVTSPADLPEVQAIYYVVAALGFILGALGLILRQIEGRSTG